MVEILNRMMNIFERVHAMQELNVMAMAAFSLLCIFGLLNCILGYRLLRFWMMLFGFALGFGAALFGAYQAGVQEKMILLAIAAIVGIILAIISFLIYKAGVFVLGAGLGMLLAIVLVQPKTSLTFFLCILAGVGVGAAAIRFEKVVLILGTSLVGGVFAGMSLAKILMLPELPYGVLMSAGFALIGILFQFLINRGSEEEDYEEAQDGDEMEASLGEDGSASASAPPVRRPDREYEDYLDAEEEDELLEEYFDDYYGEKRKKKKPEMEEFTDFHKEAWEQKKRQNSRRRT